MFWLRLICGTFCRRPIQAGDPRNVTGAFAAADWMFSIAPGSGVSASAAASLRFTHDEDDGPDGETPAHGAVGQQLHLPKQAIAASPPLLADNEHPASRDAPCLDAAELPTAGDVRQALALQADDDSTQLAMPRRRRVSFANRLPMAAPLPRTVSGANGAEPEDEARATAEWVAAQVIAGASI